MLRNPVVRMLLIGVVASVVGTAITLYMDWFPPQASKEAPAIDFLYDLLLIASVPIFVLVMTVAIYTVVQFRARPGDEQRDGPPLHGNQRLEIIWVTIPFLIVTALAIYGWVVLDEIEAEQPNALVVDVNAQQFAWSFEYPQPGGPPVPSDRLYVPEGQQVEFRIRAKDVIHSFWVPAFRLKQDAVPGITTLTRLTPSKRGSYPIVCAELCGIGHSTMRQSALVVAPAEFAAWIGGRRQALAAAGAGAGTPLVEGRRLFSAQGCAGCHTLADAGSRAATGPSLDGLVEVAPSRRPGIPIEQYVRESIVAPEAVLAPGYPSRVMPANYGQQLSPREVDLLVGYLTAVSRRSGGNAQ